MGRVNLVANCIRFDSGMVAATTAGRGSIIVLLMSGQSGWCVITRICKIVGGDAEQFKNMKKEFVPEIELKWV